MKFDDFISDAFHLTDSEWGVVRAAAESYAQAKANDAVKEFREWVITENPTWCTHNTSFVDGDKVLARPLPYPDLSMRMKPISELWKDAATIQHLFKEFFGLEIHSLGIYPEGKYNQDQRLEIWDQVGAGCRMVFYYNGEYLIERESTNADVSAFKFVDTMRKYGYSI